MSTTLMPPASPLDAAPEIPEPRIRIRGWEPADFGWLGAATVSAFCLDWLLYRRLTPLEGAVGFWICWYALFLTTYWLIVRDQRGRMVARDRVWALVMTTAGLGLVVPFALILGYTIVKGIGALRPHFFTETQKYVGPLSESTAGGGGHAVIGTLEQVGLAMLFSVPLGVMTALFLNEIGGRLARPVRLIVDAMSAVPSIIAGLFIYAVVILELGQQRSGFAAGLALSVLMLPTVTRTAEVVLRLVPGGLREGALALGGTEFRTARMVVLPTARAGLVTAVILGVARCVGETAPLLYTAGGAFDWVWNPVGQNQDALPLFVYRLYRSPLPAQVARAWTGALVLLMIVLILFVIARVFANRTPGRVGFVRRHLSRRHSPTRSAPT